MASHSFPFTKSKEKKRKEIEEFKKNKKDLNKRREINKSLILTISWLENTLSLFTYTFIT